MDFWGSWLSCFITYLLACFKTAWRGIKTDQKSPFLLLPPEILLEIFKYLDYHALVDVRQTCRTLYEMMNSEQFWAGLARDLCSKPGIGKLMYPLGNYSTNEQMHWVLRRLRTRDRWASRDISCQPLRFHSRRVQGGFNFSGAELLRGGRWLFTIQHDGTAHIIDLEKESPQPQLLFSTYRSNEDHLVHFRIWIDETKQELSIRVAAYSWETDSKKKTRICIHQIDSIGQGPRGPSFVTTAIAVIQDYPRTSTRTSTALSDKFFLQSFALRDENGDLLGPRPVAVIQLRRYSQESNDATKRFSEKLVKVKNIKYIGPSSVFFLPGDRAGLAMPGFLNVYAISSEGNLTPPKLVLLHHMPISQAANLLSAPFIGSQCTYLVGTYKDTFRRITIDHDHNLPPTVQDLGTLEPLEKTSTVVRFGLSVSAVYRSRSLLEVITYEDRANDNSFQCKYYNIPKTPSYSVICLAAFDDSTGHIVLETNAPQNRLLVLDLI